MKVQYNVFIVIVAFTSILGCEIGTTPADSFDRTLRRILNPGTAYSEEGASSGEARDPVTDTSVPVLVSESAIGAASIVAVGDDGYIVAGADTTSVVMVSQATINAGISDIARGPGHSMLAVGDSGLMLYSSDAVRWSVLPTLTTVDLKAISYYEGTWVAVGEQGTLFHSTDPTHSWTHVQLQVPGISLATLGLRDVINDGNGTWVVSSSMGIFHGSNLSSLENVGNLTNNTGGTLISIAHDGTDEWVAIKHNGAILYSNDPEGTWRQVSTAPGGSRRLHDVAYHDGTWVAVGTGGIIIYSSDPGNENTWRSVRDIDDNINLNSIAYGVDTVSSGWVAVGDNGKIFYSSDPADTWSLSNVGVEEAGLTLSAVASSGSYWIAAGSNGTILFTGGVSYTSPEIGSRWSSVPIYYTFKSLRSVATDEQGSWVIVGADGTVMHSNNPTQTWTHVVDRGTRNTLNSLAYGDGMWLAVGDNGTIIYSANPAGPWTAAPSGSIASHFKSVAYGNGMWLVVGENNTMLYSSDPGNIWTVVYNIPSREGASSQFWHTVAYDEHSDTWMIAGNFGKVLYNSADITKAEDWVGDDVELRISAPSESLATLYSLVPTGQEDIPWMALGSGGDVYYASVSDTDQISWSLLSRETTGIATTNYVMWSAMAYNGSDSWAIAGSSLFAYTGDDPPYTSRWLRIGGLERHFGSGSSWTDFLHDVAYKRTPMSVESQIPELVEPQEPEPPIPSVGIMSEDGTLFISPLETFVDDPGTASWQETSISSADITVAASAYSHADATWIAIAEDGKLYHKIHPAVSWTEASAVQLEAGIRDLATDEADTWIAVGEDGSVFHSINPTHSWSKTAYAGSTMKDLNAAAYYDGVWVIVGDNGTVLYSEDPASGNWTRTSVDSLVDLYDVAHNNVAHDTIDEWIIVGQGGRIFYSDTPAGSWNVADLSTGLSNHLYSVTYGTDDDVNLWITVGAEGKMLYSMSVASGPWHQVDTGTNAELHAIAKYEDTWIAAGADGTVLYSDNPRHTWVAEQRNEVQTSDGRRWRDFQSILVPCFPVEPSFFQTLREEEITLQHRVDQLYFIEFHNTYDHFQVTNGHTGEEIDRFQYFLDNYRMYELDVWLYDGYPVTHSVAPVKNNGGGPGDRTWGIDEFLDAIIAQVENNPDDIRPVIVDIDIKSGVMGINATVGNVVGEDDNRSLFFTPRDMVDFYKENFDDTEDLFVAGQLSLREAVRKHGWPTLADLGTKKIILLYTGGRALGFGRDKNKVIGRYIANSLRTDEWEEGIGFPMPVVTDASKVYPDAYFIAATGEKEWIIANSIKYDHEKRDEILQASKENNFLIRIWNPSQETNQNSYEEFLSFYEAGGTMFANETNDYSLIRGPNGFDLPVVGVIQTRLQE